MLTVPVFAAGAVGVQQIGRTACIEVDDDFSVFVAVADERYRHLVMG